MLVGTKELCEAINIPPYSVMQLYRKGAIPALCIGKGGRGSKLLFDVELVEESLRKFSIEEMERRRAAYENGGKENEGFDLNDYEEEESC